MALAPEAARQTAAETQSNGRLPASAVEELVRAAGVKRLKTGEVLFRPDQPASVWIVASGEIELYARQDGRKLVLAVLRSGDVTGDADVLVDGNHGYAARALEPSEAVRLGPQQFRRLVTDGPLARDWLRLFAHRLVRSHGQVFDLLRGDLPRQVARLLLDHANGDTVRLSQETIAGLAGVRRSSVNRVLRELAIAGQVDLGYRQVRITDPAALKELAERPR